MGKHRATKSRFSIPATVLPAPNTAIAAAVPVAGALGTPSSGTLTNCTGLPAAGVVGTALVNAGALGTPGSGTLTNCTGLPAAGVTGTAAILGANIFTGIQSCSQGALTIASGAITVTKNFHRVDTESAASTDDLDTINGGVDGARLVIRAVNDARDVVVTESGNCKLAGGSCTLDNTQDTIELIYDGALSAWLELGRSDNGA